MQSVKIYTDGACSGNPGAGGWGVVMIFGDKRQELSGFEPATTNNRMELTAVIRGLGALKSDKYAVEIYSDSSYVVNAVVKGWIENWKRNGWRTADKKDVKNPDLWQSLDELNAKYRPTYNWVKGHATNVNNNRCDELATGEIARAKA